jgi:hypothetical protein
VQETLQDVEGTMAQLVRISVAVRRAGARARLDRADDSFTPERHEELRQHLRFVVSLASLGPDQKSGGNLNFVLPSGDITDSTVAQRLILANLLRRHRYLYAQRRWMKQSTESEPALIPQPKQGQHATQTLSSPPQEPALLAAESSNEGGQPEPALSIITSTVPTVVQDEISIPQGTQLSMTAPSSTSFKVAYPKPPKTRTDARFFRCPCCFLTLPIEFRERSRWR